MANNILVLVDGSYYLFRAYHAIRDLKNSANEPTGAIYGVINMLRKIRADIEPDYFAVVFDPKGKTFRNDLYAEYSMKHGAQTHMRAWRTPEWKLMIDFANEGRAELYDLTNDPQEHENLIESSDPPAQAARKALEAKIRARMKELNDPALAIVGDGSST